MDGFALGLDLAMAAIIGEWLRGLADLSTIPRSKSCQLVLSRCSTMPQVRGSALLPYSTTQVFDLVNDIESYPEFLPWCSEAKIVQDEERQIVAELTIRKGGVGERFTTRNLIDRPKSIELELVQGPFRSLSGLWRVAGLAAPGSEGAG